MPQLNARLVANATITLLTFATHGALAGLFIVALSRPSGTVTESVSLALECAQLIVFPIGLYYCKHCKASQRDKYENCYVFSMFLLGLAQCIWLVTHLTHLFGDAFVGLPNAIAMVYAVLVLSIVAAMLPMALHTVAVAERHNRLDVEWATPRRPTPKPLARGPDGRVSAKIIHVVHGTGPEMWNRNSPWNHDYTVKPAMARAYDPRDRQRTQQQQHQPQKPYKTTYDQWTELKI